MESKGFTLIELLVVIAIITLLASVVLASLSTARAKAADSKVKAQLFNIRAQAQIYYENTGGYSGMQSDDDTIFNMLATIGGTCYSSATAWACQAPMKVVLNTFWCVDSTGLSKGESSSLPVTAPFQYSCQ